MREIIKKFNVYQYSELSDEAKAKVRSWYIDDPFRAEELTDMINEDLKNLFPNSELKVEWSLSSCQGDGVNVYGDLCFMDLVNMVQNHLCGDNYKAFENFFSWKEIKTAKFYSEYCGDVKLPSNRMGYTYCYVSQIDLEADFTYEMSHFRNINLDLLGKMEAYVKMVIRKYCLDWEEIGYKYLYEPDEEEVEEACDGNEWEFLEDGTYYAA